MDAKRNVRTKSTEKISRISVAISVTSLTLVTLLFMRIEFVYNNSKALETRLENRIQRIDDGLKTNIERIVKKRLQIYETASTARRKEMPDVIFGESLATRTSVLLAFNNQHYNIQHHSTKGFIVSLPLNSIHRIFAIRVYRAKICLKLYFICMLSFCQGYFWKRSNSTDA